MPYFALYTPSVVSEVCIRFADNVVARPPVRSAEVYTRLAPRQSPPCLTGVVYQLVRDYGMGPIPVHAW